MREADRRHLEERLLRERERVNRALDRLEEVSEDDGELTAYRQHPADDGTDTMEQEKRLALLGADGARLNQIDNALRLIYREPEKYGQCERCGTTIDLPRLELVPWARHCLECQTKLEAG
jgi:DnaK suppressor protein